MEESQKLLKDYADLFSKDSVTSVKVKDESEKFLMEHELESRKAEELETKVRMAKAELFETKRYLKDTLSWQSGEKFKQHIETLEKKLNNIRIQYGKVRKENEMRRDNIQIIRRNASGAHRELSSLSSNLKKIQMKTKDLQKFCRVNQETTSAQRVRMERLNASFTQEKVSLGERASRLEEVYKKESCSVTPNAAKRPRTPYSELADNMKALSFIDKKWINKVKNKEKEICLYKENVQELEDAFEVMKNIISNKSLSNTAKSFIDSCEQEKDLSSTYLRLSEKIETIEKNIRITQKKIVEVKEKMDNKDNDRQNYISNIEKELSKIKNEEKRLLEIRDSQENSIKTISPTILSILASLESLQIKASSFQLIEDPSLNSTNVIIHLNKLEELIVYFLEGAKLSSIQNFEPREEKSENKLVLNALDIDEFPSEEIFYPMSLEEIRAQAKNILNTITN